MEAELAESTIHVARRCRRNAVGRQAARYAKEEFGPVSINDPSRLEDQRHSVQCGSYVLVQGDSDPTLLCIEENGEGGHGEPPSTSQGEFEILRRDDEAVRACDSHPERFIAITTDLGDRSGAEERSGLSCEGIASFSRTREHQPMLAVLLNDSANLPEGIA